MRHLLLIATLALFTVPQPARPAELERLGQQRSLRLYNLHTGEHLNVVYRQDQSYVPNAMEKLDHFLRDSLNGAVHHLDPRLFDLLSDLTQAAGAPDGEIQVVCAYRSPSTNEYLRTHTTGVAKFSRHMLGEALDIRLPGIKLLDFRNAALGLARGGVGYYPASNFIHVDV